jgi:maltose/moltooligosaccharide transporter
VVIYNPWKKKKTVIKEGIIDYAKRMFGEKDTVKFYTAQTLWWMGFEFISMFFVGIMAQAILGAPTDENIDKITVTAVYLMGLFNIAAIFTAIPGGLIYDKIGKKRAMLLGIIIFGASIFAGLLVKTVLTAVIILIIAGLGWGIVLSSSFPVIGDLLTKYQREEFNGRYYGLFEASRSFPILLGGFGGGAIVTLMNNNYIILFPIAGISVLISIPIVLSMHMLED